MQYPQYYPQDSLVSALQFTGDNLEDINELCGGREDFKYFIPGDPNLTPGDFIVVNQDCDIFHYSEAEFYNTFISVVDE